MKTNLLLTTTTLLAGSLLAANASPKDDLNAAAKALGNAANYSWKTSAGPTEGKIERGGFTHLTISLGGSPMQIVLKGDKAAISNPDGRWQSLDELDAGEVTARLKAVAARNFKAPDTQVAELAAGAKGLAKDGDGWSGELTYDAAMALLSFPRRPGTVDSPFMSDAKGSVKFWVKDGTLSKYETRASAKVGVDGQDLERTMTIEIKDVGTTKVEVPDEAKKKL